MSHNLEGRIKEVLRENAPLQVFLEAVNASNRLRGRPYQLRHTGDLLVADDGTDTIHFCQRNRHTRYKHGVQAVANRLARDYGLEGAIIEPGGVFVDCGANVGELGYWARAQGLNYIAFEPEERESACVDFNHFGGESVCHRTLLWNETTTLPMFSKAGTADSSVFDMGAAEAVIETPAMRLDEVVSIADYAGTRIFKVEAEGAEPEVLEGAEGILSEFDYIAVDCGPERGMSKTPTLAPTNTFLVDRGFRMVSSQFPRMTALYANTARR